MGITDVREAIAWQANHADKADAPITGRVVRAELAILDTPTELARRMREWPGLSLEDAMPLRVAGGLHWLHLSGEERDRLASHRRCPFARCCYMRPPCRHRRPRSRLPCPRAASSTRRCR